jgi:hypothetical protein
MSREKEPAPGGRATNEIVEEIVDNLEAVSGQPDADLKRACDSVLQNVNLRSGTD